MISGEELPLLSAIIAIAVSKKLNSEELNVLGNFLTALSAEMLSIAAARQANEAQENVSDSSENDDGYSSEVDPNTDDPNVENSSLKKEKSDGK